MKIVTPHNRVAEAISACNVLFEDGLVDDFRLEHDEEFPKLVTVEVVVKEKHHGRVKAELAHFAVSKKLNVD